MDRTRIVVGAFALALALVAGSPPRLVGDGGEYLAMAYNFAAGDGPAVSSGSIPALQSHIAAFDPTLSAWNIEESTFRGGHGGRDFLHFWFYPLLAAPGLLVTDLVRLPPTYAFAALNLALLLAALWRALPRLGPWTCLLLWAGPIVWWIDKAHTEAFTFALLAIAFLEFDERPWWSLVAAGMAATQNLPISVVGAAIGALAIARKPSWLRDPRFLAGAVAGALLCALHPVYSYARHGTLSLLLKATKPGLPTFAEWRAVALDPQIGLLPAYPMFAVVLVAGVILLIARRHARALREPATVLAVLSAAFFLYSFARTTNLHHGATPSLSRYGLWLVPLAIPFLATLQAVGGTLWRRFVASAAVVSAVLSVFVFHPRIAQYAYEPTCLAHYLWTTHPSWNNPLPEVFSEVTLHAETQAVPAATAGCEKVLLGGARPGWPIPCFPAEVPAFCRATGQFCYANRSGGSYAFVTAPGRPDMFPARVEGVWPETAEAAVRAALDRWSWLDLQMNPDGAPMLRAINQARVTTLENPRRTVFVIEATGDGAAITLRPPTVMSGEILDALTGATLQSLQFDGPPDEAWTIQFPSSHRLVLVRLDRARTAAGS